MADLVVHRQVVVGADMDETLRHPTGERGMVPVHAGVDEADRHPGAPVPGGQRVIGIGQRQVRAERHLAGAAVIGGWRRRWRRRRRLAHAGAASPTRPQREDDRHRQRGTCRLAMQVPGHHLPCSDARPARLP